jgi:hypothetical protein
MATFRISQHSCSNTVPTRMNCIVIDRSSSADTLRFARTICLKRRISTTSPRRSKCRLLSILQYSAWLENVSNTGKMKVYRNGARQVEVLARSIRDRSCLFPLFFSSHLLSHQRPMVVRWTNDKMGPIGSTRGRACLSWLSRATCRHRPSCVVNVATCVSPALTLE